MEEDVVLDGSPVQNSTPSQPTDTTDWKGKYAAASSELGRVKKELDQWKLKQANTLQQLEAFRAETTNTTQSLQEQIAQKEKAQSELTGKLARLERQQSLGSVITKEYPELLPLHLKGLVNPEGLD
ncbi:MAG TPA: hypothetical protein PLZ51_13600, partial [Aggregatilineales bacterium]|nr:hypothetical protein [Aggregatilineales bacterium]